MLADRDLFTALARDAARGLELDWLLHAYSPLADPLASYGRFIDRVITEYENLALVFTFVTVDAGEAVYRQHTQVRALVEAVEQRPWPVFSKDAVEEWLRQPKTSPA